MLFFRHSCTRKIVRRKYCTATKDPNFYAIHNIGRRLLALRALYDSSEKQRNVITQYAWKEISNLTEEKIAIADVETTSRILVGWRFFASKWENGKNGPSQKKLQENFSHEYSDNAYHAFLKHHVIPPNEATQGEKACRGRLQKRRSI